MSATMWLAGASGGMDILGGLFGYFSGDAAAQAAESRGRMIRAEAEAEAQRYAEQARGFKATQKLAFLKSGVQLSGSPLDVLDETVRVASENISAIRARGRAGEIEARGRAAEARAQGRSALLSGLLSAGKTMAWATYATSKADDTASQNRKDIGREPTAPVPWGQYYNG